MCAPHGGRNRSYWEVRNDLLVLDAALRRASNSAISMIHTPAISMRASLLPMELIRSVYQSGLMAKCARAWISGGLVVLPVSGNDPPVPPADKSGQPRDQPTFRHCSHVGRVEAPQYVCGHVSSASAVPFQAFEMVTHRMERVASGRCLHRSSDITHTGSEAVMTLEENSRLGYRHRRTMVYRRPDLPKGVACGSQLAGQTRYNRALLSTWERSAGSKHSSPAVASPSR